MENSANMESQVVKILANMECWVTHNSVNMESRITENSANTENWVMQDSGGGRGAGRRKRCCSKQKANSMVVPNAYYQYTKMQITIDASKRVDREKRRGRAGLLV
jgi:hypothetical protein